jgi:hypothetical protein
MSTQPKDYSFTFTEWVAEAARSAADHAKNANKTGGDPAFTSTDKSFMGVENFAEAIKIAHEGYIPEGGFDSEASISESSSIEALLDVSGSVVDVGLFLSGEPECIWEFQQVPSTKFVDLAINLGNPGRIEAKQLFAYAAKVYSLILSLKQKNVECNLRGIFKTTMGGGITVSVDIHKQGQIFSPATLSSSLHPSFLRALFIGWCQGRDDFEWGCGSVLEPSPRDGEILLPSVKDIGSVDAIEERIINQLTVGAY